MDFDEYLEHMVDDPDEHRDERDYKEALLKGRAPRRFLGMDEDSTPIQAFDINHLSPAQLEELWEWGEQFRKDWGLAREIPSCWIRHHPIRFEIAACRDIQQMIISGQAQLGGLSPWIDQMLTRIANRWGRMCLSGSHLPDPPPTPDKSYLERELQEMGNKKPT